LVIKKGRTVTTILRDRRTTTTMVTKRRTAMMMATKRKTAMMMATKRKTVTTMTWDGRTAMMTTMTKNAQLTIVPRDNLRAIVAIICRWQLPPHPLYSKQSTFDEISHAKHQRVRLSWLVICQ